MRSWVPRRQGLACSQSGPQLGVMASLTPEDIPAMRQILLQGIHADPALQKTAEADLEALSLRSGYCSCLLVRVAYMGGWAKAQVVRLSHYRGGRMKVSVGEVNVHDTDCCA